MAVSSPVKFFHSAMPAAPQVTNVWGSLTAMLDAVLINGFGQVTIDSLTVAGNVATAQVSTGHPFTIDQVVMVGGAAQGVFNGEHRVTARTVNSFSFALTGAPASASGSMTAKVAPLNFEIAFTGTNKRAYRSKNVQSPKNMLLINDGIKVPDYDTNWAKWANVGIVSSMSDIDTITGMQAPFDPPNPNYNWESVVANQWGWHKWYFGRNSGGDDRGGDGGGGSRSWVLVGDDRMFYLFMSWNLNGNFGRAAYCFGDIESFRSGDVTHTVLCADDTESSTDYFTYPGERCQYGFPRNGQLTGKVLLRSHTQIGVPARWSTVGTIMDVSGGISGAVPFPNAADYSLLAISNVMVRQSDGNIRGTLPGMLYLPQNHPYPDLTVIDTLTNLPGRKVVLVDSQYNAERAGAMTAFDITGPWR
jgi:hypothetical protein